MENLCARSYRLRKIKILNKLENVGQGQVVEKQDLHHSIVNINLRKSSKEHFCASCCHLRGINIFNLILKI